MRIEMQGCTKKFFLIIPFVGYKHVSKKKKKKKSPIQKCLKTECETTELLNHVKNRKLCMGEMSTLSTYPPTRWEGGVAIGSITEAVAWGRSVWRSRDGLCVLFGAKNEAAERVAVSQQNYGLHQLSQRPALLT